MEIRNAVILTRDDQPVLMSLDELRNFTGNVVFCRSRLSAEAVAMIDDLTRQLRETDTASPDGCRMPVEMKLIG